MQIRTLHVSNFRSLRNSTLNFSETTALIGENNCGKSSFLHALDLFFTASPRVKLKDFADGNTGQPIDITVSFSAFTPADLQEFDGNLLDGELIVTRRFYFDNAKDSGKFFVSAKVNPDFSECRNEEGKTAKLNIYKSLQDSFGLPKVSKADDIEQHLLAWEEANPGLLQIQKLAGFKGWTNVASGKLKQKTDFIFIRAVEDAEEHIQANKNSPVRALVDTIARQAIENTADYKAFLETANSKIAELTDPNKVPVLSKISDRLTTILEEYYADSAIHATWEPITQIQQNFPTASIEVTNNSFTTSIDGVGHGLQRAVILTVLQFLAEHRAGSEASIETFAEPQSDIILAIEEPEIYQHPVKQRLFAKLLRKLAKGFNENTGIRIQVIYVTHSPLMVSISECDAIRMIRRMASNVLVREIDLNECAKRSATVSGRKIEDAWSRDQYSAKLHTFRSEAAEGFFGKCVVLVEGVGDKAILEGSYGLMNRDPYAEGIVIVDVAGKNNIDKPIVIFNALGIPCYWIFDNDKNSGKAEPNRILQRLGDIEESEIDDWPKGVFKKFTAWDFRLEKYVETKVGVEAFNRVRGLVSELYEIDQDMCLKFPAASFESLRIFNKEGYVFSELEDVIKAIDRLASEEH